MNLLAKKTLRVVWEIVKWGVILWLLLPLVNPRPGDFSVTRVVLGILLLVLFSGKIFYDRVLERILKQPNQSRRRDIFTMLGVLVAILLMMMVVLVGVGYYILSSLTPENGP